jgi:hypothetical protein
MFHMELDTSVFGSNMNLDAIDAATDEVPGINRETATQAFGYACRHGVRLRVAAHWIMRARGMTVRSLAGELDVSASHLNQLFIHPHRHYFHRRKKRLLAERLGFDIWLYPEPLCCTACACSACQPVSLRTWRWTHAESRSNVTCVLC